VDRAADLADWVKVLKNVHERRIQILAFANNHYAGYGPATLEMFRALWNPQASAVSRKINGEPEQGKLFE
jgi:uncharacterized protein YecE (DUF72 family)